MQGLKTGKKLKGAKGHLQFDIILSAKKKKKLSLKGGRKGCLALCEPICDNRFERNTEE